ncbi:Gfo/Idh/MocA family oxidoreductase, partial [Candidatus Micrarchaeota archaeon]|nr:Gfo/Idh/MocA family oxidoreductase [Candidatus Micrarchaeota archaeon]
VAVKKLALFGCGGFAGNHLRELAKRREVRVSYLIDPSVENRERLAAEYKKATGVTPECFSSLKDFLSRKPVFDAGIIVTPAKTHAEIAKAVLKEGKHVFVEKPFTTNVKDAETLVRMASKKKLHILIGTNRTVFPAYRTAANALKAGVIGELQAISYYYKHSWEKNTKGNWRQDPKEEGSGLLADHSPHYNHFLFTDLGFKPKKIVHLGSRFNKKGVDVVAGYQLTDEKGRVAVVLLNGSPSGNQREEQLKICGTKGDITVKFEGATSTAYLKRRGGKKQTKLGNSRAIREIKGLGINDPYSHPALIHNFVSLISGKTNENANPGREGLLPVRVTQELEGLKAKQGTLDNRQLARISKFVQTANAENIKKVGNGLVL